MKKKKSAQPASDNPKTIISKIRSLLAKGYHMRLFDNVMSLRYDFLVYRPSQPSPAIVFHLSYEDFSVLMSKASPGLAKTYEGMDEQIREIRKQQNEILDRLTKHIEFPVAK